jgi:large subunit ribosomal protein L21
VVGKCFGFIANLSIDNHQIGSLEVVVYAIVECGGRQYRAEEGHSFIVEKLPYEVGEKIELDRVLLISDEGEVNIGQPAVDGALVKATVVEQFRGKKIFVWKYRPRKRYRRRQGHRQSYTRLLVDEIIIS